MVKEEVLYKQGKYFWFSLIFSSLQGKGDMLEKKNIRACVVFLVL